MSEPIRLYKPGGEVITVYTRSQAATMLAGGEWYASEADASAGKVAQGADANDGGQARRAGGRGGCRG
jgi:hypothetical protein